VPIGRTFLNRKAKGVRSTIKWNDYPLSFCENLFNPPYCSYTSSWQLQFNMSTTNRCLQVEPWVCAQRSHLRLAHQVQAILIIGSLPDRGGRSSQQSNMGRKQKAGDLHAVKQCQTDESSKLALTFGYFITKSLRNVHLCLSELWYH